MRTTPVVRKRFSKRHAYMGTYVLRTYLCAEFVCVLVHNVLLMSLSCFWCTYIYGCKSACTYVRTSYLVYGRCSVLSRYAIILHGGPHRGGGEGTGMLNIFVILLEWDTCSHLPCVVGRMDMVRWSPPVCEWGWALILLRI